VNFIDLLQAHVGKRITDFAPPVTRWLDGVILHAEHGKTRLRFTVREEMTNPAKVLHGGMHTTIMDDAIGMTIAAMQPETLYLSANLSVDLLGRAVLGEEVDCEARIVRHGKTLIHAEAEIRNLKGELLSRMTSNLANTGQPFTLVLGKKGE